jgi:hypothetical protein
VARCSGGAAWPAAAVTGLAAIAGAAVATIGFRHDVGAAVSYHDLFAVVLRWHSPLAWWSWIAWIAVAAEAILLIVWCVVRSRQQPIPRRPAVIVALLFAAWAVQFGLAWHSHHDQQPARGQMSLVAGATAVSDSSREATLATDPLFPAYGWFGLVIVVALAAVILVTGVRKRRGGS